MTKEELKKKYHGQYVSVSYPIRLGGFNGEREAAAKSNALINSCKELGLQVALMPEMAMMTGTNAKIYAINDPSVQTKYSNTPVSNISVEEFLEDFGHYAKAEEEKEFVRAKQLLDEFKIEYGSIEKKHKGYTATDTADEGFIQGYTSNEASLWWHPMGRRVFFVRGEGAFELTDKVEPKEENAHV